MKTKKPGPIGPTKKEKRIRIPCYFGDEKKPWFTLHWPLGFWCAVQGAAIQRGLTPSEWILIAIMNRVRKVDRTFSKWEQRQEGRKAVAA